MRINRSWRIGPPTHRAYSRLRLDPDDDTGAPATVTKVEHLRRLASKQTRIEELTAIIKERDATIASAPDSSKAEKRYQALEKKYEGLQTSSAEYRTQQETKGCMVSAGILDADDQDLVLYRHGRLGDGAPELSAWLEDEKGARADRHLGSMFSTGDSTEAGKTAGNKKPDANRGTHQVDASKATTLEDFTRLPVSHRISKEGRAQFAAIIERDAAE